MKYVDQNRSQKTTSIAHRHNINSEHIMVSVCCITFNHEDYISEAIDSFLMQEVNFGVEILVHDDASNDKTADIIRNYAQKYPHLIKPILQNENQYSLGTSPNVAYNFPRAKGKYIAMCEGDDFWTDANKLQMQVDYLETNPEIGMIFTDCKFYRQDKGEESGKILKNRTQYQQLDFINHLVNKYYLAPPTWLIRTSLLKEIKFEDVTDGSFVIALEILRRSKVYYLDKVTATYRLLCESASHSKDLKKMFKYRLGVFRIQQTYCQNYLPNDNISFIVNDHGYASLMRLARQVGDSDFERECMSYFEARPFRIKVWYSFQYHNEFTMRAISKISRSVPYRLRRKKLNVGTDYVSKMVERPYSSRAGIFRRINKVFSALSKMR